MIVGNHPHAGEYGRINFDDQIQATGQALVELENCQHGKDGCYVTIDDVKKVNSWTGKHE